MIGAALALCVSAVLFQIGAWGRRNAAELVPVALSEEGRLGKERALRRGSRGCQVVAILVAIAAFLEAAAWVFGR